MTYLQKTFGRNRACFARITYQRGWYSCDEQQNALIQNLLPGECCAQYRKRVANRLGGNFAQACTEDVVFSVAKLALNVLTT